MNPRLTPKDRNAVKGALRRAFARSTLHGAVIGFSVIAGHEDPTRPRVLTWCRCNECQKPEAMSYCVVDHIAPLIPVNRTFEEMTLDEVVDRLWCEVDNLQVLCPDCHDVKTASERKQRKNK